MSAIIQSISEAGMLAALEANMGEEVACFGRGILGAELHEDAELRWFITHRRHLNGVVYSHFEQNDSTYVHNKIRAVCQHFAKNSVDLNWPVTPVTYPQDLATHLLAHGFSERTDADTLWMALDIQHMSTSDSRPKTLTIAECTTDDMLKRWKLVCQRGFGDETGTYTQTYYENYLRLGFGEGKPWHHYLAWLDNEAVAATSLLLHAGLAGIYGVNTIPEARRQGVGVAITAHALREAEGLGYRIGILSPSHMGMNVYRRLGFQDICHIHHYLWQPDNTI